MSVFMLNGIPVVIVPKILVQKRIHKKKRINKKWRKRYGFVEDYLIKDGDVEKSYTGKLFMNENTYIMLKKNYQHARPICCK